MADPFFSFQTIGDGSPYMTRLLIGRLRLYIFHRGDGDPDPHDHPWSFWTFPLTSYVEEVTAVGENNWAWIRGHSIRRIRTMPDGSLVYLRVVRAWRLHHRPATHLHRVLGRWNGTFWAARAADGPDTIMPGKIVTLVWRGKGERRWGFLKTRDGRTSWQHWKEYVLRGGRHAACEPVEPFTGEGVKP